MAANVDEYQFVGVVPEGSTDLYGEAIHGWNVDDPSGTDEVGFIHAVVDAVAAAYSIPATAPRIALGFSNGAGVSELLGCHNSHNLWVALRSEENDFE